MKANRAPRTAHGGRRFRDDERGVSEAVGYVITFGISTIILVTSLSTFTTIRDHTSTIAVDSALRDIATQVVFAVEEALRSGATYPDATFSMTIQIPEEIDGISYDVELHATRVAVIAREADAEKWVGGEPLDVKGRYYLNFLQRAGSEVLCSHPNPPAIPGGACVISSGEGQITVVHDEPTGFNRGVYLKS